MKKTIISGAISLSMVLSTLALPISVQAVDAPIFIDGFDSDVTTDNYKTIKNNNYELEGWYYLDGEKEVKLSNKSKPSDGVTYTAKWTKDDIVYSVWTSEDIPRLNGNYILANDVKLIDLYEFGTGYGGTLIIDLNGKIVDFNGEDFANAGTLIIEDTSEGAVHYFDNDGGLWKLNDDNTDSEYKVTGGVITNGRCAIRNASDKATIILKGGNFVGNDASGYIGGDATSNFGSAISVQAGMFEMSGGSICGNYSQTGVAGVFLNNATAVFTGGSITNNTSMRNVLASGLYAISSMVYVGGSIRIQNNDGVRDSKIGLANFKLSGSDSKLIIGDGVEVDAPNEDMLIGVCDFDPIAEGVNYDDANYFSSDDQLKKVVYRDADGLVSSKLVLVPKYEVNELFATTVDVELYDDVNEAIAVSFIKTQSVTPKDDDVVVYATDGDGYKALLCKNATYTTISKTLDELKTIIEAGSTVYIIGYSYDKKRIVIKNPPSAITLTYNASKQKLITEPKFNGDGEVRYSTGTATAPDEDWSKSVTTATDAGTYFVWYKIVGSGEYSDTNPAMVKSVIEPLYISVRAEDKKSTVGESLVTLTYKSDKLCGSDKLTGKLETTAIKTKVGQYPITQGTLSASDNYVIVFTEGIYSVKKKASSGGSGGGGGGSSGGSSVSQRFQVKIVNGTNEETAQVTVGQKVSSLAKPSRAKKIFKGWYSDAELTNHIDENSVINSGVIFYAGFKSDPKYTINMFIDKTDAKVFGEDATNDVAPIIRNDRTMLPARFVSENLGASIEWDGETKTVTVTSANGETVIKIQIDSDVAIVNDNEVQLDSPAFIENDRAYTPVRFIVEALGAEIEWNAADREVIITK